MSEHTLYWQNPTLKNVFEKMHVGLNFFNFNFFFYNYFQRYIQLFNFVPVHQINSSTFLLYLIMIKQLLKVNNNNIVVNKTMELFFKWQLWWLIKLTVVIEMKRQLVDWLLLFIELNIKHKYDPFLSLYYLITIVT